MAKIAPFTGIHYNLEIVDDIAKVVCPPYDIIDAKGQEEFYQKHPYNIIRLILGKELASDSPKDNKYARAAAYLEEWQRRNILLQDKEPAIYFYEQDFIVEGQKKRRLGFIALLRLEEEGENKSVYPHEHTHAAPKEDRLNLIKSVEANLSPIFTIFSDPENFVKGLFTRSVAGQPPLFAALEANGVENRMWRLADPGQIEKVRAFLDQKEIFIADGHHRYEVARMYRDFKKTQDGPHFKDSHNYIMTYFTALEDEGLCVLPTHRLVKNANFSADSCAPTFIVRECSSRELLVSELKKKAEEVGVFGLYKDSQFYLLKLSDKRECNRFIQEGPKEYKNLDVVILHKVLFDQILKVSLPSISYEVNLERAINLVDEKAYDALFILNPTKIEQIRSIALGGEVMPQKSTYFYPKLLSGLLIHKF